MTTKLRKDQDEVIVTQDLYSEHVLKNLQKHISETNAYITDFEQSYGVNFTNQNLQDLINDKPEVGKEIASNYYAILPPEMRANARKELAEAIQGFWGQVTGVGDTRPPLKFKLHWLSKPISHHRQHQLNGQFAEIDNARFRLCADAEKRLKSIFTEKITGENLEAYRKAEKIVNDVNDLRVLFGAKFLEMFDVSLYGETINVNERIFIDVIE